MGIVQKCWQLEGWDIPGAAYVGLRRRIAVVAHIRSEGCHGRQTERKRREWTKLKRITEDERAITFERTKGLKLSAAPLDLRRDSTGRAGSVQDGIGVRKEHPVIEI